MGCNSIVPQKPPLLKNQPQPIPPIPNNIINPQPIDQNRPLYGQQANQNKVPTATHVEPKKHWQDPLDPAPYVPYSSDIKVQQPVKLQGDLKENKVQAVPIEIYQKESGLFKEFEKINQQQIGVKIVSNIKRPVEDDREEPQQVIQKGINLSDIKAESPYKELIRQERIPSQLQQDEMEEVHNQGAVNFTPSVRNINFRIQIS